MTAHPRWRRDLNSLNLKPGMRKALIIRLFPLHGIPQGLVVVTSASHLHVSPFSRCTPTHSIYRKTRS